MPEICADMIDNNCNSVVDEEGCTGGGTGGCNPEITLISDSALWSETPGVVWILFPFNPSNTMTYFWSFGDGNTSTEAFPTNIYELDGTYTVCLTVTDANGCTGMTCVTFTVTPEGDFLPGGMPMTGFTLNVVNAVPNNVTEVAAEAVLEAFPCPFNDELTLAVQSPVAGLAQLSCYDMTGALVSQEQINVSTQRNTYSFSTATWSHGAYTIVVTTPSGSIRRVVMK
jgi:PKD repeat protein